MLVGSRFKQRYAKKMADDYYMLPAQWNGFDTTQDWRAAEEGLYSIAFQKKESKL